MASKENWLAKQLRQAESEVENWPAWKRNAMRLEIASNRGYAERGGWRVAWTAVASETIKKSDRRHSGIALRQNKSASSQKKKSPT